MGTGFPMEVGSSVGDWSVGRDRAEEIGVLVGLTRIGMCFTITISRLNKYMCG